MRATTGLKRRNLTLADIALPTAIGLALYFLVMAIIESNVFGSPLVIRYFAGHWVSKATTAMACVGLAALLARGRLVIQQLCRRPVLTPVADASQDERHRARAMLDQLLQWGRNLQSHYRTRRFRAGLQFIERTGSPDGLDDELKYLADVDVYRQGEQYAFVRILIWATPLLGFLGTVLGISQALGAIQLGPGSDFQQMMSALRNNLYVAFDTTALALILSIALMFVMFLVNRLESDLLTELDQEVREAFGSWFEAGNQSADDQVRAMHRIGRAMVAATHEMSQKQIEVWRRSIEAAQSAWLQASRNTYELLDAQLGRTLHDAVTEMAEQLSGTIRGLDQALDERGRQWQDRLVATSERALVMQQRAAHDQRQAADLLETTLARSTRASDADLGALADSLSLLSTRLLQFVQAIGEPTATGHTTLDRADDSQRLRVYEDRGGERAA